MKSTPFKSILAHSNLSVSALVKEIETQNRQLLQIRAALPEKLATHIEHCLVRNRRLIIYTRSAAWASQIRFYSPAIVSSLNQNAVTAINSTEVRVSIESGLNDLERKRRIAKKPSAGSLAVLSNLISSCKDNTLKQALSRLHSTLKMP